VNTGTIVIMILCWTPARTATSCATYSRRNLGRRPHWLKSGFCV